MIRYGMAATIAGLLLLGGCGRGEETPGQPSADERRSLDNVAQKLDEQPETFDTSPDSMVPADEGAVTSNGLGTAPAIAVAPGGNSTNAAATR